MLDPQIDFKPHGLDATWPVAQGREGLATRLRDLGEEAVAAVRDGAELLIVSDRSVDAERAPVPGVLATGAVHHALVAAQLRTRCSLIAETDDARDTHSYACLLGYGADAICPRLALESMAELADNGRIGRDNPSAGEVQDLLKRAAEEGVLKIMSKMGISTLDSYRSAQIFEAVGLSGDVIDLALCGTPSKVGGVGCAELADDILSRHAQAFGKKPSWRATAGSSTAWAATSTPPIPTSSTPCSARSVWRATWRRWTPPCWPTSPRARRRICAPPTC